MKNICPPRYHHNDFVATHATITLIFLLRDLSTLHDCIYTYMLSCKQCSCQVAITAAMALPQLT